MTPASEWAKKMYIRKEDRTHNWITGQTGIEWLTGWIEKIQKDAHGKPSKVISRTLREIFEESDI